MTTVAWTVKARSNTTEYTRRCKHKPRRPCYAMHFCLKSPFCFTVHRLYQAQWNERSLPNLLQSEMVQHSTDTPTRRFATRHGTLCCNTDRHGTNTTRARTGASRTRHGPTRGQIAANTTRNNTARSHKQHGTHNTDTRGQHAANTQPTRSQHAANTQPTRSQHAANTRSTRSQHAANTWPTRTRAGRNYCRPGRAVITAGPDWP